MAATKDNGITPSNPPQGTDDLIVVIFHTMALYNVAELALIIPTTFKRRSGNYFWFFVLATSSIVPYSVCFICKYHGVLFSVPNIIYFWTFIGFTGWCGMVLFQSLVLWSRLHLVMYNHGRLRAVLYMIVFNAVICDVPAAVLIFGSRGSNSDPFVAAYGIFERVQITLFAIQEFVISIVYIFETAKMMRVECEDDGNFNLPARRRVMTHLICVSVIVVILDIPTLALQYSGQYAIQTAYKGFAYSVKLKLEFSILNRLVDITRSREVSVPTMAPPAYSIDGRQVDVIIATSSSADANPSGSRDESTPASWPTRLPRLPRFPRPYDRDGTTQIDREGGAFHLTTVNSEADRRETMPAIQVGVQTEVTVKTSENTELGESGNK